MWVKYFDWYKNELQKTWYDQNKKVFIMQIIYEIDMSKKG